MTLRRLRRFFIIFIVLVALAIVYVLAKTNPQPWSAQEIARLTAGLNEAAAIGVPHDFLMDTKVRNSHLTLLEKVEAGTVLTINESQAYRQLFQETLLDGQRFLAAFDAQLSVLPDHAMHIRNNVNGDGIAGHHDHHDLSARANFAGLLDSLQHLESAKTALGRIMAANAAQKDLVDLISHLGVAPHTVSVPYEAPITPWHDDELGSLFEAMLKSFKDAQFSLVNSPHYWSLIDDGLMHYNALILTVQDRVTAKTTDWERRIAGRFMSKQTLAPPVDIHRALRRD